MLAGRVQGTIELLKTERGNSQLSRAKLQQVVSVR